MLTMLQMDVAWMGKGDVAGGVRFRTAKLDADVGRC